MRSDPDADRERFATPRRLHPASMVLGIDVGQIFNLGLIPLVALFASGGAAVLVGLGALAVVTLVVRVLDWRRRRYSFDGSELRVESGILGRSLRSLDVGRIQQLEVRRKLIHRIAGLATVRVETAGSASEPEVELRVVSESDAQALRRAVRAAKARTRGPGGSGSVCDAVGGDGVEAGALTPDEAYVAPVAAREPVLAVPLSDIVVASVTGRRLLVLPIFIAAGLQVAGDAVDQLAEWSMSRLDDVVGVAEPLFGGGFGNGLAAGPDWRWMIPLGVAFTLVAVAAAAITGLLRDGGFRLARVDDDLHVSRGLLASRDSLVPLARVQSVKVRANWLRRILGFVTVEIRSAGGSAGGGGRVTIPLVAASGVDRLLTEILPGVPGLPTLDAHPIAARRRSVVRQLIRASLLAAALALALHLGGWLGPWTLAATLTLPPAGALLGIAEYRNLAHGVTDRVVVSRHGALSVATQLTPLGKVQAVGGRSGPFQRRLDLGSLDVHVAGPSASLTIRDASRPRVSELHRRLAARAARSG